ncbi:hypothetical protein SAVIM338S_04857 [Streptomyces avidinii]
MTVPLDEAVPIDPIDPIEPPGPAPRRRHRPGGDPVKALLHRHRELCERAVDPLEIAAGLEAHGITDRTAARFRHRDVFSLAEELYARTPRAQSTPAAPAGIPVDPRTVRGLGYALLPGALALGAAAAGVPWAGALAVLAALAGLGRPLRAGRSAVPVYLLAAAVTGWAVLRHGTPLGVALAVAVAPGYLAGSWFASRSRRRLAGSRALEDFADGVKPLLVGTVLLFTAAAAGAAAVAGAPLPTAVPLAVLLFLTRLMLAHGAPRRFVAASMALALVPVAAAPFAAAAGLLVPAVVALSRASAHARP